MPIKRINIIPQRKVVQLEMDSLWEVAPGVKSGVKPSQLQAPRLGVVHWEPAGDGLFRPLLETHPAIVALTDWDERLYGCSQFIIKCLVEAGFVEGERLSPRGLTINLESFFQHRAKMRENPWFWSDSDNLRSYTRAADEEARKTRPKPQATETALETSGQLFGCGDAPETSQARSTPSRGAARPQKSKCPA